jgi:hypothetical protein
VGQVRGVMRRALRCGEAGRSGKGLLGLGSSVALSHPSIACAVATLPYAAPPTQHTSQALCQ